MSSKIKAGTIYIMVAEQSFPGWVKVGLTTNDGVSRAKNMHTGSPYRDLTPWKEYSVFSTHAAEKAAHDILKTQYVKKNEWFECSPEAADLLIRGTMEEYTSPTKAAYVEYWRDDCTKARAELKAAHKAMHKELDNTKGADE